VRSELVRAASLGPAELARWSDLQRARPVYRSPFFRPEFAIAVGQAREVLVAVVEDAGSIVGFLPYEIDARRAGRSLGWPYSDYHGPVLDENADVDPRALVRAAGLGTWTFDHLPAALTDFAAYSFGGARSPYLDLADGLEAYLTSRRPHSEVRDTLRKARKLAREVGPLRFVPDSTDSGQFGLLLEWKRRQYAETGVRDVLADAGSVRLVEEVFGTRGRHFSGTLSVLYAGDEVAALLLGVQSETVWHSWFPVFHHELGRYSPGLVLLLELARAAEQLDIREIDLGKGEARYKAAFATDAVPLLEGCVGAGPFSAAPVRIRRSARRALRRVGLHRAARRALHRMAR
jgi:CelD/BcsL family acetyltransferase involved in cellulose biosynthesis